MGEEGEATLGKSFIESFGSGGGQKPRSPVVVAVQREREREERKKRKKKGTNRTGIGTGGASLIGTLLCYKGASECLSCQCGASLEPAGSQGCHNPWRPSMHLGRQDGWLPVLRFRYGKSFLGVYL
jgi:hypothetical protein